MKTLSITIKEEESALNELLLKYQRSKSENKDNAWDAWMLKQIESKQQTINKLKEQNGRS